MFERDLVFVSYSHRETAFRDKLAVFNSPDGSRVLSSSDNTLREWDARSGVELRRFEGHSSGVSACAYTPDGRHIASASHDNTLKLWCTATGRCLHTVYGVAAFLCIAVTRGQLAAGDALGNLWILDWDEP